MQIKHIVLLAVVVTGLFSCNALNKKEALKMNNTLVSINNNLYYKGREYGTLLSEAVQTKDFSKLPPCRASPRLAGLYSAAICMKRFCAASASPVWPAALLLAGSEKTM